MATSWDQTVLTIEGLMHAGNFEGAERIASQELVKFEQTVVGGKMRYLEGKIGEARKHGRNESSNGHVSGIDWGEITKRIKQDVIECYDRKLAPQAAKNRVTNVLGDDYDIVEHTPDRTRLYAKVCMWVEKIYSDRFHG